MKNLQQIIGNVAQMNGFGNGGVPIPQLNQTTFQAIFIQQNTIRNTDIIHFLYSYF